MTPRALIARTALGTLRSACFSASLFLVAGLVPLIGGVVAILAPAPILSGSVGFQRPRVRALIAIALAAGLVGLAGGSTVALIYLLTSGLAAIAMAEMLARRKPFETIVLVTTGLILTIAGVAVFVAAGSPQALGRSLHDSLAAGMAHGRDFYRTLGVDTGISTDEQNAIVDATIRLFPALAAIAAAFSVLFNLSLFWRFGGSKRLGYPLFGDLARWSAPEWLIWVMLATGFALFVPFPVLRMVALDCFICVASVYFCQGMAIMAFYFRVLAMPSLVRGIIYLVTGIQPVLAAIVCAAGIFDLWIDFRRLKPPRQEAGTFGDFL